MKFTFSIILALAFTAQSALAVTLYRNGGASKAYNKVRTPTDYDNPTNNIVPANPNKGVRPPPFIHPNYVVPEFAVEAYVVLDVHEQRQD